MAKRLLTLALALAMLLCASTAFASGIGSAAYSGGSEPAVTTTTMYVYTENGKALNVRSTPSVETYNIIGSVAYGSSVAVIRFTDNGWACIKWGNGEGYVQSRYLLSYRPAVLVPSDPVEEPYYGYEGAYTYTDTLATLNAEFRTARIVAPYVVIVRPSRASGWVNMRWAPSKDTEILATYRSGARLTVIAETQSWYQVVDPDTEATGFIMKAYTIRAN